MRHLGAPERAGRAGLRPARAAKRASLQHKGSPDSHASRSWPQAGYNVPWIMDLLLPILRILVGAVLLYAGISKLLSSSKTRTSLEEFGVTDRFTKALAVGIPIAELLIATAILLPATAKAGLVAAYILFSLFTAVIIYNLLIGRTPACGCFGQRSQAPISIQTVLRNFALMAVTAIALGGLQTANLLIIIIVLGVPLAAVLVMMIALLYRILERTEQLEERLEELVGAIQNDGGAQRRSRTSRCLAIHFR